MDRAQQALKRLGIDRAALASAPDLSGMIKEMVHGGMAYAIKAMRFSLDDPDIAAFLGKYDSIPVGDREKLPWQAIALAAELDTKRLLGAIGFAVKEYAMTSVKLKMISSQPLITAARIKYAQLPSGEKDRTAHETALGILPSPKGPTFIGKMVFGGATSTNGPGGDGSGNEEHGDPDLIEDGDLDINAIFPGANTIQEKLIPIRQRLLESGDKEG